ncbi:hypothetical protein AOCH_004804 [Aspergillus ochraceoroseus]|nr:hypothetical protein AOCH_004804 [Aspergillus ochraceoroseus]
MRHVRDPQFDRRVSELEAYSRKYPRLSGYTLSQKQQQQQQQQQTPVITHTEEEEEEEEEEEQEDNDDNDEAHDTLLTPRQPPTITPAQNQSQAEDPEEDQEEDQEDPLKTPTQKSHRRNNTESSTHAYIALAGSPMQLSSPPSAAVPETGQRGDAVDGLLKLMNTAEKGRGSEWMI